MEKTRVLIVCGGKSAEHEVSLVSAISVARALNKDRFEVLLVGIDKGGRWLLPSETQALLTRPMDHMPSLSEMRQALIERAETEVCLLPSSTRSEIVASPEGSAAARPSPLPFDVVFPLVHGTNGEDGTLQGLFELAGVPYAGPGVLGSAVGMDKDVAKRLMRDAGIPVVPYFCAKKHEWEKDSRQICARAEAEFGYPYFVKPANCGSSVGVHKVHSIQEAESAFRDAFTFDRKVLAERACIGREIECAVLGNDHPRASVLGEIKPTHEFYDYEAKYVDEKGAELMIPAHLSPETTAAVRAHALAAFQALEIEGMARVDFFVTHDSPDGVFLNEVNTIPGFTPISMFPQLWAATGLPYPQLLETLVELALQRHADKKRLRLDYST